MIGTMTKIFRLTLFAAIVTSVAAVWAVGGALAALAAGFSILGYMFVLGLKNATEEILRYEMEQRPDLYA
jgi:hypothetical protein